MTYRREIVLKIFRGIFSAYFFLLVLALYAETRDAAGEIKWLVLQWFGAFLCAGWLLAQRWFSLPVRRPRMLAELVTLFCALLLASALASQHRWASLVEFSRFFFLTALYFTASQVFFEPGQVLRLFRFVCAAVGVAALYAALQAAGYDPFPWESQDSEVYRQLPSTFGNPNYAAHVLVLALPVTVLLLMSGWFWALPLMAGFAAYLWHTGQRGGVVALAAAAGVLALAWLFRRLLKKPHRAAAAALVSAALLAALAGGGAMALLKWRTGTAFPVDASVLLRYQSLVGSSRMALSRPVLGFGPGCYKIENPRFWTFHEQENFARDLTMNHHVHNDPLELAVDSGLPAAGVWLALMCTALGGALIMAWTARDQARRRLGWLFAAVFTAFFVDGLFGFNLRLPVSASLLFVFFGLMEGLAERGAPPESGGGPRVPAWLRWPAAAAVLFFLLLGTREFAGMYHHHQGVGAQASKQYALAARHYELGRMIAPWKHRFPWRLGQLAMVRQDMETAEKEFNTALALNPNDIVMRTTLAEAQMVRAQRTDTETREGALEALRLYDAAAENARFVLELCPMFAQAHDALGRAASLGAALLAARKNPDIADKAREYWQMARTHLQQAVVSEDATEGRAGIYRNLGRVCVALSDFDGAEQAFARAAQADPADDDTWPLFLQFAREHNRFGRLRTALSDQIDWLRNKREPDRNALATMNLFYANVLEVGFSDLDGAEDAYGLAVQYAPLRGEVWTNLARFAFTTGRIPAMRAMILRSCDQLAARTPPSPPLPQVAAVDAVLRRGPEAMDNATLVLATAARSVRPDAPLSPAQEFGWAGIMLFELLQQDAPDEARTCNAAFNLALVFAVTGEYGRADMLFNGARRCLAPELQPALVVQWADMRVRQDRAREALTMLEEALASYPDDMDLSWAAARAMVKMGRREDALRAYRSLLESDKMEEGARAMLREEMSLLEKSEPPAKPQEN